MRVLIFEDESLTAERLVQLLNTYNPKIEILGVLETIKAGMIWFENNPDPDLIFMDIHLADGSCFELFSDIQINVPVIFTTAYDEYAIQAFKVNSIGYLLKPVDYEELKASLYKYKSIINQSHSDKYIDILRQITRSYKQGFLVKSGDQYKRINTTEITYFIYDESLVFAYNFNSKRFIIDQSIEKLEKELNPNDFFRINRKMIISLKSIVKIHKYFNNRLKLSLTPKTEIEVIVSRERTGDFKKWLDR